MATRYPETLASSTMTYEEFIEWAGEDVRAEWVNGKVVELMPPTSRHQALSIWLSSVLYFFVRKQRLGTVFAAPYEMKLSAIPSSRQPDILVSLTSSAGRIGEKRLNGAADLVVEIISDDSVARDRRDKFAEYAHAGVSEYWIIDPRLGRYSFQAYLLSDEDYFVRIEADGFQKVHSVILPGFVFDPAWIGEDPLPDPDDAFRALIAAATDQNNR